MLATLRPWLLSLCLVASSACADGRGGVAAGDSGPDAAADAALADTASDSAAPDTAGSETDGQRADVGASAAANETLIDNARWEVVPPASDPFAVPAREEPPTRCEDDALLNEEHDGLWFTVDTLQCDYATVSQPSVRALAAGETVQVRIWHFAITELAGEVHLAIGFGDDPAILWEERVPVPTGSGLLHAQVVAERDWPAGTPVTWHLSNHGSNSWSMVELATVVAPEVAR